MWVDEEGGDVVGWLATNDFENGRPAYHATAEVAIYVKEGRRGMGRSLLAERSDGSPGSG